MTAGFRRRPTLTPRPRWRRSMWLSRRKWRGSGSKSNSSAHKAMSSFQAVEPLEPPDLTSLLTRALAEDIGHGDITTAATVRPEQRGRAVITAKESRAIFCGGILLHKIFSLSGADPTMQSLAPEGTNLSRGAGVAEIEGLLSGLLIGERTALNFIQLMSGIASATSEYVRAI